MTIENKRAFAQFYRTLQELEFIDGLIRKLNSGD